MSKLSFIVISAVLAAGCSSTYRGIPSHGGGKRFSEEQRAVTGAIRKAIAGMKLSELEGKRVRVMLTGIPTSGSGNISWGGWTANVNGYDRTSLRTLERVYSPNYQDRTRDESSGDGGSVSFRPNNNFYTSNTNTDADTKYLKAALDMRGMHSGIRFTNQKPEAVLHVLVDVLGTNRSRTNFLAFHVDKLKAECELSYYAVNASGQEFLFRNRRCGAEGEYSHTRCLIAPVKPIIRRTLHSTSPPEMGDTTKAGLTVPKNGDHPDADPEDKTTPKVEKEKNEYLKTLANRLRGQLDSGKRKDAQNTLQQILAVDPSYEELPELRERFDDEKK